VESSYDIQYRVRSNRVHLDPPRQYHVHASQEQVRQLVEEGYFVRERLITGDLLEQLREAADALEAEALKTRRPGSGGGFNGLFVRNIIDQQEGFLPLLTFGPTLSVARAVLGPQVQVSASVLRVSYPDLPEQGVEWHFHQRVVPDPEPAFFWRPVAVDNLIYLDDITSETGPLVVLPKSHLYNRDLPSGDFASKPGEVVVTVPAGSVVTSHSSLWHRALPTQPESKKRRLLILGYTLVWQKAVDKLSAGAGYGLTDRLMEGADEEMRELLGVTGWY
jgi:hypothetical protein